MRDWILYTLFAATGFGLINVFAKNIMKDTPSINFTAIYSLLAFIFYTPVFIYYSTKLDLNFQKLAVIGMSVSMIGNVLAFLVFNYSVKKGNLSEVVPISRLTPVFAALIAAIVLGEKIDVALASGIFLATSGAILVLKEDSISYLNSVKEGIHKNAIKAALLSAVFWAITSVADRYATQIIPPELYNYFLYSAMTTGFLAASYHQEENTLNKLKNNLTQYKKLYVLTGLLAAASSLAIFKAFSLAPAAKVTTVQQFQVLIPVIAGVAVFDEKNLGRKLTGSIILITGIALTAI